MSTAAVSTGPGHTQPQGANASNKASGASSDKKTDKTDASQAPRGDVFAMLLMMMGDGQAPAPEAVLEGDTAPAVTEEAPLDPMAAAAWGPASTASADADTDPVQAMLASRYPLERSLAQADPPGLDADATGRQDRAGMDITALGMTAVTEGEADLLAGQMQEAAPATAPARPAPGLALARADLNTLRNPRLAAATHQATHLSSSRAVTDMAAQAAVTLASRSGEVMARNGVLPMRSTVTLDARLSPLDASTLSTADVASVGAAAAAGGHQAQGFGSFGEPGQPMAGDTDAMGAQGPEADSTDATSFGDAQAAAEDEAASTWHAGQLQQARLSIAGEAGETIDVQLQLAGESVNVEFRTDDELARQELSQDGGRDLSDRLQQEGLALVDVSVGGRQGSGARQGQSSNPSTVELGRASSVRRGSDAAEPPAVAGVSGLRPRTDPTRPLDMFV